MATLRRSDLFGTWSGENGGLELELRVDTGRDGALDVVSGDVFIQTDAGPQFHHSFRTTHLIVFDGAGQQTLRGPLNVYTPNLEHFSRLDLVVPDDGNLDVTYVHYVATAAGPQEFRRFTFAVSKKADQLRHVELEVARVAGVPAPTALDTTGLPGTPVGVPPQLDVAAAFDLAGIDLPVREAESEVPVSAAGADGLWTDEELHAAMEAHFAEHRDEPQWRLWLLLATRYVNPGVVGIMFDSDDPFPRQGAAVFAHHPAIAGATGAERDREYLFTVVHELGHAFNLLHSFQKFIFDEGRDRLARPGSMSWMNYPDLFPFGQARPQAWNGAESYWSQFGYTFDAGELEHLRHFHAMGVVMGGDPFGASGHRTAAEFQPVSRDADLELNVWVPPTVEFMEVVEGDVRLKNVGKGTIAVAGMLGPAGDSVDLLVQGPGASGPIVVGGIARICARGDAVQLGGDQAVYGEITPSFDRLGWVIDRPGTYLVQGLYHGSDGRRLASPIRAVNVRPPARGIERLADELFTRAAATYFGLEGSRAATFASVRDDLAEIADRLPGAAVTRQIRLTNAVRDTRVFKDVAGSRVLDEGRDEAAREVVDEVTGPDGRVAPAPTQSHLRVGRQLASAARCYGTGSTEQRQVISLKRDFLAEIDAPQQAFDELDRLASDPDAPIQTSATLSSAP